MSEVGKNIKRMRVARHMSQDDLAIKLGVTRSAVSGWEVGRNEPSIDMLKQIATTLHVSVVLLI